MSLQQLLDCVVWGNNGKKNVAHAQYRCDIKKKIDVEPEIKNAKFN